MSVGVQNFPPNQHFYFLRSGGGDNLGSFWHLPHGFWGRSPEIPGGHPTCLIRRELALEMQNTPLKLNGLLRETKKLTTP